MAQHTTEERTGKRLVIPRTSGGGIRHRISRSGDRQLNFCLHIMAIAQSAMTPPGCSCYQRKRAAGKPCDVKRHLADPSTAV
jgi:hypothetical protein